MSGIGLLDVLQRFLGNEGRHGLLPFGIGLTADLIKGSRRNVFGLLLQFRRYDAVLTQKVGYALADDRRFDGAVLLPKGRTVQVTGSRRRPQVEARRARFPRRLSRFDDGLCLFLRLMGRTGGMTIVSSGLLFLAVVAASM